MNMHPTSRPHLIVSKCKRFPLHIKSEQQLKQSCINYLYIYIYIHTYIYIHQNIYIHIKSVI